MATCSRWWTGLALLAGLLAGCGDDPATAPEPVPPDPCPPPNRLMADGACLEPGVQDDGCPAGALGLDDGGCLPAGIPPEQCADGFEGVGDGCEPILPAEGCGPGLVAVPGEISCRAIMSCGSGAWGDLPVDESTVYVDGAYAGGNSDGSEARPWTTIAEAVAGAADGALVALAEGSYAEDVVLAGKRLSLWGVCPERVEIAGAGSESAAVRAVAGADGSELGGVAIIGAMDGIDVTGAVDVVIDRVWVHDTAGRGIAISDTAGSTSVTVRDSLVEGAHELGIRVAGAEATLETSVVRGTLPRLADQALGRGINARAGEQSAARATLTVRGCVVEGSREIGIFVSGSDATIEGSVVATTQARASDDVSGVGIAAQNRLSTGARASLALRSSMVERNHHVGVLVLGSDGAIETTVVRGTQPQPSDQTGGSGIVAQHGLQEDSRAVLSTSSSLIEGNHHVGVFLFGSDAEMEGTIVRGTKPNGSAQSAGDGLAAVRFTERDVGSRLTMRGSVIDQNRVAGVMVSGSEVHLQGVVVRDTSPRASDQLAGMGVTAVDDPSTAARSLLELDACVVERNQDTGVFVWSSDATVGATVIAQTSPDSLGRFGDGLLAFFYGDPAIVALDASTIEQSERAAVSAFGSEVSIGATELLCQRFDLAGVPMQGRAFDFIDLGDNRCGCPAADGDCDAEQIGLEPPTAVAPPD